VLTGLVIGWARGGRLGSLGQVSLKNLWLVGIAVGLVLVARLPWLPSGIARAALAGGYLGALVALWQNRQLPWMLLVFFGLGLNSVVIALNEGRMPISGHALISAAQLHDPPALAGDPRYLVAGPRTPLAALGDTLPLRIGGFGTVLSPGDLLMALGLAGFIQAQMCISGARPPNIVPR
jgi:hypothetical protein